MRGFWTWLGERRSGAIVDSVVAVALATGAVAALDSVAPATGLGVVYLLAVLYLAIRRSEAAALATAVLSVLTLNYFFIEPRHRLTISDSKNVVALAVFLIVAVVVGRLAQAARARATEADLRAREAAARTREAELLASASSAVLAGDDMRAQLDNLSASIASAAGATNARLELAGAPSNVDGEIALRLPTAVRPCWLYLSDDVQWDQADLDRVTEPLARLIDVALERERVARQLADAEAAQRADVAKTAVLHAISHDLRSPLTAITTATGALRSEGLEATDTEDLLAVIEGEAARLARLVDDLMDLSRIEAGAVNPLTDWCDLSETMASAAAQAQAALGAHPIAIDLPPDLPLVKADPAQLERVFANLLSNAIKFGPAESAVRVSGGTGGGSVTVRVTDSGRGIPASKRLRIFEPFFRGDGSGSGTGLGLAICRGFVEANGGTIHLHSGAGQGTSFSVSFPLVPQPVTLP